MVHLIDIRKPNYAHNDLRFAILNGLTQTPKTIPTLVLYDDLGLQLFDQITYLDEYYLTRAEINILTSNLHQIVEAIPDGTTIFELGSGSLRKTKLILDAVNAQRSDVAYYALDLMEKELIKSLSSLGNHDSLKTYGLWGTYEDGMEFINQFPSTDPKLVLWMGSSIGNLTREEAATFLSKLGNILNPGDKLIIGIDLRNPRPKLALAYNDPNGITRNFIMNGLKHCNQILQQPLFNCEQFEFLSRVGPECDYHESLYRCKLNHKVNYIDPETESVHPIHFREGEEIHVEYSIKYTLEEIMTLVENAKLNLDQQWLDANQAYSLNLLTKPSHIESRLKTEEQSNEVKKDATIETSPLDPFPIPI